MMRKFPYELTAEKNMSQIDKVNFGEFHLASAEHFDDDSVDNETRHV